MIVTALGYEYQALNGHPRRVWLVAEDGYILAEAMISRRDTPHGGYAWVELPPLQLPPGSVYYLAAETPQGTRYVFDTLPSKPIRACADLGTYYKFASEPDSPIPWEHSGPPRHYVANAKLVADDGGQTNSLSSSLVAIVEYASAGLTDKEIAVMVGREPSTIESQWRDIRRQVGAVNRAEVIAWYARLKYQAEVSVHWAERSRLLNPASTFDHPRVQIKQVPVKPSVGASIEQLTQESLDQKGVQIHLGDLEVTNPGTKLISAAATRPESTLECPRPLQKSLEDSGFRITFTKPIHQVSFELMSHDGHHPVDDVWTVRAADNDDMLSTRLVRSHALEPVRLEITSIDPLGWISLVPGAPCFGQISNIVIDARL